MFPESRVLIRKIVVVDSREDGTIYRGQVEERGWITLFEEETNTVNATHVVIILIMSLLSP